MTRLQPGPTQQATSEGTIVLQDRYVLHETIGRGGMATVYRAVDRVLDRPVAVKLLYPAVCGEPRFVEQFLRMERHIARLYHPNLVTIYDAGAGDEGCFAVMEYVSGGSLRELLERGTPLPIEGAIRIAAQVADALQLLHSERIIHGDVKPDNVLLDEEGNAKLVDFGIAHLATTTASLGAESLGGSVPYLAPEQLEHGRADARSDIYALGLVLYELLAGRRAFDGENWVAVATQRLARDPVRLGTLRPDLPAGLEAVVMRALARDPAERFGSAEALREALSASLPGAARSAQGPLPTDAPEPLPTEAHAADAPPPQPSRAAPGRLDPDSTLHRPVRAGSGPPADRRAPGAAPAEGGAGSAILRLVRGEHPLAARLTAGAILVDLVLLVAIVALRGPLA